MLSNLMRVGPRKILALLSAVGLLGCAGGSVFFKKATADPQADTTVFQLIPRHESLRSFRSFHSATGWSLVGDGDLWVDSREERTDKGVPAKSLIRRDDRKCRISVFEMPIAMARGESKKAPNLHIALAYLFKSDPQAAGTAIPSLDSSLRPEPSRSEAKWIVFTPPKDTLYQYGLMAQSETYLLFLQVESKSPLARESLGALPGLSIRYFPKAKPEAADSARKSFQAAVENTWGLKAVEDSSYEAAASHFRTALALDPAKEAYLINCMAMYQVRKDIQGGVDFLIQQTSLLASSAELAGTLGALYEELGRYQEAKAWALKALELNPLDNEWLINLSDALWGLGERVHSKNVLLRRYAEKPDFRLSVYLASTYLGLEEYENAKQVLLKAHQDTSPSPKSVEYFLRSLSGLKEYEAALDFARELGANFPATSNNFLLKGICEFNLKLYRSARKDAQSALDLDPSNREAQQLSTQISALIGNRSNLILRTPITPLKTKAAFNVAQAMLKDPENQKLAADFPMTLLIQDIVHSWSPKSRWKRTRHQVFHIREGRKLIRFSELTHELNPGYSRFFVNRFRLYDASFKIMEDQKVSDFYVTKNHNSTLHPENLLVHLPVKARPGVQYLEVISTEEAQLPTADFPYLRYDHSFSYPVLKSTYSILRPPKNLLVSTFGQTKVDSLPDRLVVHMDEPALPHDETFNIGGDEFGTGFSATPFTTWREVGGQYFQLLEKSGIALDSVPFALRERAQEITDRNRGMDPVKALFRFVRDSVRYTNYEFGLHALVPDKGETVVTNGYSDCKGHALLLTELLRARGIDAHIALVSLPHTGDLDQPSLHQFNHMIVHVPAQKGIPQHFLDATEKHYPFRRAPLALEGKNVLIIDRENSRMATIPELDSADEHRVQVFHTLRAEASQTASGIDSLVLSGKVASEFREHIHAWNQATRYENLLSWLAQSYPSFYDDRFRILNEEDVDSPLVMVFSYKSKFPFRTLVKEFEHYPKLELSFLRFPKATSRRSPVYFPHEIKINSQWVYEMPKGFEWKSLTLDRELTENHLHWLFSISQSAPESILIKQNWKIDPFVATPEEYSKFQSEWNPILAGSGLRLNISKR